LAERGSAVVSSGSTSVVRASSAAAEHSCVIVRVVVVTPWSAGTVTVAVRTGVTIWSGVRAMAVLAFAALSTEGTWASGALVLALSTWAVVVRSVGVGHWDLVGLGVWVFGFTLFLR
jgi:hypothetical protein